MDQLALSAMLADITAVRQRSELLRQYKGYGFNLLQVLGADTDEVKMCRLLYELLSPQGSHGQGTKFLKLFYQEVLGKSFSEAEIAASRVYREYSIKDQRRIDLFLAVGAYAFPIEVKIYAGDQEDQCKDYFAYAKAPDGEDAVMYYLTLDGHPPSSYSTGAATGLHVVPLSFAADIIPWLDTCAKAVLDTTRLRESILQIKQAMEEVCGIMNDEEQKGIEAVLKKSFDNFQSAEKIYAAMGNMKEDLLRTVFREIISKVTEIKNQPRVIDDFDYENKTRLPRYYSLQKNAYPGISFVYHEATHGIPLVVRAELDNSFYVSYFQCAADGKKYLSHQKICELLNIKEEEIDHDADCWFVKLDVIDRWYGSLKDKYGGEELPDFKKCNKSWFDLFDDAKRNEFTTLIADRIVELLNR